MKNVKLVKIETIVEFGGMEIGTSKEVPLHIANQLIERGRVKLYGTETPSNENPYSKLKLDELRSLCAEKGIEFSDEKKAELIVLLLDFDKEASKTEE